MKINVWHGVKHDDYEVTEVNGLQSPTALADLIRAEGYFRTNGGNIVPWHRIHYIEKAED